MGDVHHIFPKEYLIDNGIKDWSFENYEEFLLQRRKLMAAKIKSYYFKL